MTAIGAAARAVLEVRAGLIPEKPIDGFTRQFWITADEWNQAKIATEKMQADNPNWYQDGAAPTALALLDIQGKANAYAAYLMVQPDLVNWVRTDWVWL